MPAEAEPTVAAWVKSDPAGPLRPAGAGALPPRLGGDRWAWVDVTAPTADLAFDLGRRFHLPERVVEDVLEPDIHPQFDDDDGRLLFVFHLPAAGDHRVDTAPVVCVVGPDLVLTFHDRPQPGLEWLLGAMTQHAALVEGGPDQMIGRLAEFAAREFHPLVEGCDTAFDALADRALEGEPAVLSDTQALRRDAALLRGILGPQREAILGLAQSSSPVLGEEARRRLRDAFDRHQRLVEEADAARLMLASVADTYRAAVAEKANDVMKVLTVFSAILLPLSLMAGLYGMNFDNMPELHHRWSYPILLTVMAITAISLWMYFVKRGFIGRPRVARVGRGVLSAARAPARTVSSLMLRPAPAAMPTGPGRTQADLDRETIEVVADLFRLGWQAPRALLNADPDGYRS